MATFYLDPINGNDANDGTTFANRWKTFNSGATAARTAPGDTIRVIASPDPTSLGQNATWTDGSDTVTLTTAVTADIEQSITAWTASANVTTTTNASRKIGATSSSIAPAAGFTTGLAAYKTITLTDLSAYQQVSFWIKQTAGTLMSVDGDITIKLCSDTVGAVALTTISVPAFKLLNTWNAFTIDTGGALSSVVNSIGFYVNTDRGAQTFLINNILAVKSVASADSLSLTSRISKNTGTEDWYHIQSISGTSVVLETFGITNDMNTNGNVRPKYSGTTGAVTTYKLEPLQLGSALVNVGNDTASPWATVQEGGTSGNPITYSGGWDRTAMSSQTGDTFISGVNGAGHGITLTDFSYITFDKINVSRFYMGMKFAQSSTIPSNITVTAKSFSANTNCLLRFGTSASSDVLLDSTFNIDNMNCNGASNGLQAAFHSSQGGIKNCTFNFVNMNSNYAYTIYFQGIRNATANGVQTMSTNNTFNITNHNYNGVIGSINCFIQASVNNTFNFVNFKLGQWAGLTQPIYFVTSSGNGILGPAKNKVKITGTILAQGNTVGALVWLIQTYGNVVDLTGATISGFEYGILSGTNSFENKIIGGTFSGNGIADIANFASGDIALVGSTLSSTTKTIFSTDNVYGQARTSVQNYGGTANDHRNFYQGGTINSDTTTRHTASGISWKMSPTSTTYTSVASPLILPLATFAVNASSLVTVTAYVYRSNTGLTATLKCPGGQLAGVSADVTSSASGSASTWEQLTITFTPSEAGIISVQIEAYGGSTYSVYVDDITVSQA